MPNLAEKIPSLGNIARPIHEQPGMLCGRIDSLENGSFIVQTPAGTFTGSRAAGCLLDPQKNDQVLLFHSRDECWILTVLKRNSQETATLSFEKSVQIKALQGSIHLVATESISSSSAELEVHAEKGSGIFGSIDLIASTYRSYIDNAVAILQNMNLFCRHMQRQFLRSIKRVEEHEDEYAATRTIQGNKVDIVTGSTEIKASGRVAVNASQYHVN